MSEKRAEDILQKIAFVENNKGKYKNPQLILDWLYTLLLNF